MFAITKRSVFFKIDPKSRGEILKETLGVVFCVYFWDTM